MFDVYPTALVAHGSYDIWRGKKKRRQSNRGNTPRDGRSDLRGEYLRRILRSLHDTESRAKFEENRAFVRSLLQQPREERDRSLLTWAALGIYPWSSYGEMQRVARLLNDASPLVGVACPAADSVRTPQPLGNFHVRGPSTTPERKRYIRHHQKRLDAVRDNETKTFTQYLIQENKLRRLAKVVWRALETRLIRRRLIHPAGRNPGDQVPVQTFQFVATWLAGIQQHTQSDDVSLFKLRIVPDGQISITHPHNDYVWLRLTSPARTVLYGRDFDAFRRTHCRLDRRFVESTLLYVLQETPGRQVYSERNVSHIFVTGRGHQFSGARRAKGIYDEGE